MSRTNRDFSKHQLIVKENNDIVIHHLKIPDTNANNIKFINTNGVLIVIGDFGNWIFCRTFIPSATSDKVSDSYWIEKLHILSSQTGKEFSKEMTEKELDRKIDGELENYGYKGDQLKEAIQFYKDLKEHLDCEEWEYISFAYENMPNFFDPTEAIIKIKDTKPWLKTIFDAYEEICKRLREK